MLCHRSDDFNSKENIGCILGVLAHWMFWRCILCPETTSSTWDFNRTDFSFH